jgi:hypothetical protein
MPFGSRIHVAVRAASAIAALACSTMMSHPAEGAERRPLSVELAASSIVVKDVTPGEAVILFGASHRAGESIELKRSRQLLVDGDRDGSVEFALDAGVPVDSIWIAVDISSGRSALAAPSQSAFRKLEFPAGVLHKGPSGSYERYASGRRMVDLLIVRPRVGAWVAHAIDGHQTDADQRQDGTTSVVFAHGRGLGAAAAPPPRHLTPRDVVVVIDVRHMEYYLTEVAQ